MEPGGGISDIRVGEWADLDSTAHAMGCRLWRNSVATSPLRSSGYILPPLENFVGPKVAPHRFYRHVYGATVWLNQCVLVSRPGVSRGEL